MPGGGKRRRSQAELSRRALLRGLALCTTFSSSALGLVGSRYSSGSSQRVDRYPFQLGVASGDPASDGVVLWTRLAPEPLDGGGMPPAPVEVGFEIARDPSFRHIEQAGVVIARPELAHAVHVEFEGLSPARDYWFRFLYGDASSPIGRTKTAPASGDQTARLRFASCGCSHFEAGYFTAYRHMADEDLDFVYHCGDYIYEAGLGRGKGAGAVRRHRGGEPYTLTDYRNRYALYKSDPDLMAAHASAPFVVSWDDHEIDNDWAADHDQDGTPPELFLFRRAAAYQAYYEHMPLRRRSLPTPLHLQLYRQITFGQLLNLNVLDTRQYRSDQVCRGGYLSDCPDRLDPTRSLLGQQQEAWLFDRLATSSTTWNVLAQQVPMFSLDQSGVGLGRYHMDKWDGYEATRTRLFEALAERRLANPVILSGDVHTHWAADIRARPEDQGSPVIGTELTATSISSGGDGADTLDIWPEIEADNPHIHHHSNHRGYLVSEVTTDRWTANFKTVDRVSEPGRPMRQERTLVVERARPGLQI
ncbi:MAG: alkaline phosphatase D family protein [Pseudomonadota bacterium]